MYERNQGDDKKRRKGGRGEEEKGKRGMERMRRGREEWEEKVDRKGKRV